MKYTELTIDEIKEDYSYRCLWAFLRDELPHLPNSDLIKIVSIVSGICPHCYEKEKGNCNCTRDD